MKCQKCDEKATVHLTQLEGEKMKKISLCESCAQKAGLMDFKNLESGEGFANVFNQGPAPQEPFITQPSGENDEVICSSCGFTSTNWEQTGRFGCEECYEVFAESISLKLGSMHRGLRHRGRRPIGFPEDDGSAEAIAECETQLREAILTENYEAAARLRDEIQRLHDQQKPSPKEVTS